MGGEIFWAFIKLFVALPVVLVLACFVIRYIIGNKALSGAGARRMRVLERLPLTPKTAVVLLELGGRYYLLALHEAGVTLLKELEELPAAFDRESEGAPEGGFADILQRRLDGSIGRKLSRVIKKDSAGRQK
ncbi:MAG: flagellar biosynthetic protein FliO [Firmicutes bacterium]|nr:flagellar biosynthetic protein FliO [Bacillota bacterium]